MKKVLIPFSGGLDSTYLVYKNLFEGNIVQPVYITIKNINFTKSTVEKEIVKKLFTEFKKEFNDNIKKIIFLEHDSENEIWQFNIWLHAVKKYIKIDSFDEIHLGIVSEDLTEIDNEQSRISKAISILNTEKIKLPLAKTSKIEINKLLPLKYNKKVYSCEIPIYNFIDERKIKIITCGTCRPCLTNKIILNKEKKDLTLNSSINEYEKIKIEFNSLKERLSEEIKYNENFKDGNIKEIENKLKLYNLTHKYHENY